MGQLSPEVEAVLAVFAIGLILGAAHILNVKFNTSFTND